MVRALRQVKEAVPSSRPASIRSRQNPFVKAKKKAGSKKLGLDLEKIPESTNLREQILENAEELRWLRIEMVRAENDGRRSAAKKLRRQINQELEAQLYLHSSWCLGCNNVAHNCQC
jgi:hypothetical protein